MIQRPKGRWPLPVAAVAMVGICAALYWGFLGHDTRPGTEGPEIAEEQPRRNTDQPGGTIRAPSTAAAGEERKPAEQKPARPHQLWVKGDERAVALLHVAAVAPGARNAMFCLPLSLVPRRRGPLTTADGEELDAQVIVVAWQRGLVLLQLPASAGTSTISLPVRPAATLTMGDQLRARDVSLRTDLRPCGSGAEVPSERKYQIA